jgi:hypothetical protein
MYQWTSPFVVDSSAFTAAFGSLTVTPHAQAIAITVDWLHNNGVVKA